MLKSREATLRDLVHQTCIDVNIIFPEEFGLPQICRANDGILAAFPDHVMTLTRIGNEARQGRIVVSADTVRAALLRLFSDYAVPGQYDTLLVQGVIYRPVEQPFGTVTFVPVPKPSARGHGYRKLPSPLYRCDERIRSAASSATGMHSTGLSLIIWKNAVLASSLSNSKPISARPIDSPE